VMLATRIALSTERSGSCSTAPGAIGQGLDFE
jgi:hypothetical protein